MKKILVSIAALVLSLSSSVTRADGSRLHSYLGFLEGHWDAKGLVHKLGNDGRMIDVHYDGQMQVDRTSEDDWALSSQITDENGAVTQNNVSLSVRGELLFVMANGVSEPVNVIESTPTSLTYKLHRVDAITGRQFDFTFHNEIDESGKHLRGHNTAQTNGVTIVDETFTALRW